MEVLVILFYEVMSGSRTVASRWVSSAVVSRSTYIVE